MPPRGALAIEVVLAAAQTELDAEPRGVHGAPARGLGYTLVEDPIAAT